MILERVNGPADLRGLSYGDLDVLAAEIRRQIIDTVTRTGGHLGSNLGAVELTLALHRAFESPKDVILWDTGHQTYAHKLITGRAGRFEGLRQEGGLSGYPSRRESVHDWIENSHASTALSYAHGLASAMALQGGQEASRRVVAVVGDGALTGGMAFEALNNLGHAHRRVVIVLNDNGRSYAPTVSRLSESLTRVRLSRPYQQTRERVGRALQDIPGVRRLAQSGWSAMRTAVRELLGPNVFFDALGIRYTGPIDGHDIEGLERALTGAAEFDGPIVVHVLTEKGKGYPPAEQDVVQRLHDYKVRPARPAEEDTAPDSYTDAFTAALVGAAERDDRVVAITAAMPGPTGLIPFEQRFSHRFFDVGIAEQHAVTAAAGMAMAGLRPVVAIYSTFFNRAFDQASFDVGLHRLPVVFVLDRAGITGDDGPSHHGVLDLVLTLGIPGMTVLAPSSPAEVAVMLEEALRQPGPCAIRWPKTPCPPGWSPRPGSGLRANRLRSGRDVCILAVGKMVAEADEAAAKLEADGISTTVWDVRVVKPLDIDMLSDAASHPLVVTVEDGVRIGGAGSHISDALAGLNPTRHCPPVLLLGTPLEFIPHGRPDAILAHLGLDGDGIAGSVRHALARGPVSSSRPAPPAASS